MLGLCWKRDDGEIDALGAELEEQAQGLTQATAES